MNNKYYTFALTALLILASLLAFFGMMSKPKIVEKPIKTSKSEPYVELKSSLWDNYLPLILKDDYKKVNGEVTLQSAIEGRKYKLDFIASGKYKIIIRYSYTDCELCIDQIMNIVSQLQKKHRINNVIALVNAYSERDFFIRAEHKKYPVSQYNIGSETLGLFSENKNFPLIFLLTPDLRATKIFIPTRELSEDTEEYLENLLTYISDQNG